MNRTGLIVALAIAAAVGVLFGAYPELDLRIAALLFTAGAGGEPVRAALGPVRDASMWLVAALVAPAAVALLLKLLWPRGRMLIPGRSALFLIATLALGPGVVVNVLAKDHWGRPRPAEVVPLGGTEPFVAWWDPRGSCPKNCSFVSGEAAGGFWTMAPAALAPAPWRPFAYAAAVAFGSGVGLKRMIFGGHFFTDVVFAGVFTFLVIWLAYNFLYRWQAARWSDAAIEQALARLARPATLFRPARPADSP